MPETLPDLMRKSQALLFSPNKVLAEKHLRYVHKRFPDDPVTLTDLASLAYNRGNDADAEMWIRKAMKASEKAGRVYPHTWYTKGQIDLKAGRYYEGFHEFEWRFYLGFSVQQCPFETLWDGSYLSDNATLVLWNEQGLGDQIMMARFVKQAKEQSGAKVVLVVHESLVRLFEGIGADVVTSEWSGGYDRHAPLLSLPRIMGVTLENLDGRPYLRGNHAVSADCSGGGRTTSVQRLGRVGICWSGQCATPELADRSIPERLLDPIKEACDWGSLQYGEYDFFPEDFLETAEAIAACDLVITIDTSLAHLAGALGKECWVLLRYHGEWRWLRERTDSPWYNSCKLIRQSSRGDWAGVVERVTADLKERYASRSDSQTEG